MWASSPSGAGTFAYRKAIAFNGGSSGVSGGPHASFPVLVSLVDPDLRDKVASPSGYDIVFRGENSATCGGPATCALDHEIERWDPATGTLVAWVRVPALSAGTTIGMYYGNGQITAPTETPRAVWDAGYVGVWHLGESGAGNVNEYRDSSRYGNHGRGGRGAPAATPTRVAGGPIGFGQHFGNADGTYDFIDLGDDGTLRMTGNQITLETWVRHNITVPAPRNPYGILNAKGYFDGYSLWLVGDGGTCGGTAEPCLSFNLPGSHDVLTTTQAAPLARNVWHLVTATYDGALMRLYVDGLFQGSRAKTGNISPSAGGESVWIGQGDQPTGNPWSGEFEGELDELRISRVARSASWIATEFNNQKSPAAFYSVGAEVAGPYLQATLAVNYRSIGTNPGILYSTGTASVALGATAVTLAGASLPANVGAGDVLTFTGSPAETAYVLSRDSATQLSLQGPVASDHTAQTYTITRAYNKLPDWEAGRRGNLVGENRREIGVAYRDGVFTSGVTIDGSTTDTDRYMKLTVAPGERHRGSAGTGVVLDNSSSSSPAILILDDFVSVEWFEIKGGTGPGAHGIEIGAGISPDNLATVVGNVIHDTGGDGVRLSDPDSVVAIENNVIYRVAGYGIHFPADMTAAARVNVFNNTIYGCTGPAGPTGMKSDVRQTSTRIDLRNNIAHSNLGGDLGISPFFDRAYFYNGSAYTQIGNGGLLGPTEYLADRTRNFQLDFSSGSKCLYVGSARVFRGVNVALPPAGAGVASVGGVDLQWSYWNGAWTSLETGPFSDGAGNFVWEGAIFWPNDPAGWTVTSVNGSPNLYYVRTCLASGGYDTLPTEAAITRIDVAIASRDNLTSDITGRPHSALFGGQTGQDSVLLTNMHFLNTTPGAEDLHIDAGSAAQDAAADLGRVFTGDIDGTVRAAPWDIGADEAGAPSGPDLSITKVRASAPPVAPGASVKYWITVTNNGPGVLASVKVTETLPPEIGVPTYTPSTGSYDPATRVWSGLSLAPSQTETLELLATIDPWARAILVNTARVDPDGATDPYPANDSATVSDTLTPSADLALDKTSDADPVADLGGLLTYTLTVTNNGPSAANDVIVTDPLPPPTEFDSAEPSQGSCSFDNLTRTVNCPLGGIPYPGSATVTLRVRPMARGTLTNTASVAATEPPDPAPGNDSDTLATDVQVPTDGVPFFTVTSTPGMNVLEWLNPSANYAATEILVRTDRFPTALDIGQPGISIYKGGAAGERVRQEHSTGVGSNGQTFYYAAFVHLAAGPPLLSSGRFVRGGWFDTTGHVKWAFSTGGFSVTPPTVGGAGVIATSNDMVVHAMARGIASPPGGEWPAGWLPFRVGAPVQSRSPIVPIAIGGANPVAFLGSQDGYVHALDATLGGDPLASKPWAAGPTNLAKPVQAAPAGIFTALNNYLLVGTRDASADNRFFALDPKDGSAVGWFDNGGGANGIGIVNGMASVDYDTGRAYFASHARTTDAPTLWCVQLPLSPGLAPCTGGWAPRALGDIDSSPVLRGGRVYVGSAADGGTVYSIDPTGLTPDRSLAHNDGQVKGFIFPNRGSGDLYFATDNKVWSLSDTGSGLVENFPPGGLTLQDGPNPSPRPSAVLFVPGGYYLYVGASNGRLYQINLTDPLAQTWVQLGDGKAVVGAPSFDRESGLIHVGTEAGVFYAVSVPLP